MAPSPKGTRVGRNKRSAVPAPSRLASSHCTAMPELRALFRPTDLLGCQRFHAAAPADNQQRESQDDQGHGHHPRRGIAEGRIGIGESPAQVIQPGGDHARQRRQRDQRQQRHERRAKDPGCHKPGQQKEHALQRPQVFPAGIDHPGMGRIGYGPAAGGQHENRQQQQVHAPDGDQGDKARGQLDADQVSRSNGQRTQPIQGAAFFLLPHQQHSDPCGEQTRHSGEHEESRHERSVGMHQEQ